MTEDLHDIGEMGSFVVLDYIQGKGYRVRVRTKSGMVFVVYWQEEEPPLADTTLVAHGALGAESSCSAQTPYEVADTTLVAHGAPGTESSCSSQTPYEVAASAESSSQCIHLGPAEMLLNCSTRWSAAGAGSNIGGLNCIGGDWTNCIAGDWISCLDVKFPPGSGLYCFLGRTQEYFDKKTEKGPNIFGWVDGRFYL